tara:strand:- start:852 stop:1193 length:342 start_codon:yes stop_codon:yes gene_type:complete
VLGHYTDIETGLAMSKANPDLRVACLATQERFDKNPLQGKNKSQLVFCANHHTELRIAEKARIVFEDKGFHVTIAEVGQEKRIDHIMETKRPALDVTSSSKQYGIEQDQDIEI